MPRKRSARKHGRDGRVRAAARRDHPDQAILWRSLTGLSSPLCLSPQAQYPQRLQDQIYRLRHQLVCPSSLMDGSVRLSARARHEARSYVPWQTSRPALAKELRAISRQIKEAESRRDALEREVAAAEVRSSVCSGSTLYRVAGSRTRSHTHTL